MVRYRYPLALIPSLAYLVGLIIIITVIRHKVARFKRRDSRLASIANEKIPRDRFRCAFGINASYSV